MSVGLQITRRFTEEGKDPYGTIEWSRRDSRITNPDGSVVFEMKDAEIPAGWSQVAADIMVSKYFRKAGVPQRDDDGELIRDENGDVVTGPEQSARQVFDRLASTWRHWGEKGGYFAGPEDAEAFEDELKYMLAAQMAAPNSPQWFNTGLNHAYGITGPAQGFWYVDPETEELTSSPDSYSRPAPHACFPADTRITTSDGFSPIEKIEPGDEVLTHIGRYRRVTQVMQRQVDEELVKLKISKLTATDLTATANHPVLAVAGQDARRLRRTAPEDIHASWVEAGELRVGDYVVVAHPRPAGFVPEAADLSTFVGPNYSVDDETITTRNAAHHPSIKRFISFDDPALMRLFGRWLGDGSLGRESRDGELSGVHFVFDADDRTAMEDVSNLMQEHFGVDAPIEYAKRQRTAHLRYIRRPLARWFEATFGEGFAGKSLPGWVFEMPAAHRLQLLVGLFASDGCVLDQAASKSLCFDHSNQNLAEGVWRLARSLGYSPALIGGTVRVGGSAPHFRVQISVKDAPDLAELCGVEIPTGRREQRELHLADGNVAYRVRAVEREPFYGTVYNFQVEEDESYVANGVAVHNCFILGVKDDLVNPGGIMDLWTREARIFKFGSGAGSNFSQIRGENELLSGGGKSSGVMSFLKIGDRAAGAIKSGGTTRRAAKMVILDVDHPDIEAFVDWKKVEEDKARLLIQHGGFPADFNGEAYATVSGQNSNNSVRVSNDFIQTVLEDGDWELRERTTGQTRKTIKARDLWQRIARAAWACADPGLQFDTTINEWHTSPAGGRINASNPCSEYLFLDDTACNLASINLVRFETPDGNFDIDSYRHAIRIWTLVLEISVAMAHFPSAEIAQGSYDYRTLGLGYANLGSLLMRRGIAYDSDEGRAIAGALTAILTGHSYATSAEMASAIGPFPKYWENAEAMLRVIRNHRRAAYNDPDYEDISHKVLGIDSHLAPADLVAAARDSWDRALQIGEQYGYRNAQASVLAPTGTIGLLLDCDTTGVEPDFSLVKFKKLAGGGYFKIANQSVAPALRHLGYADDEISDIVTYIVGTSSLDGAPHINRETLAEKGFTAEEIDKFQAALPSVFELRHAFNVFTVGEEALQRLGLTPDDYTAWDFDLLAALGFSRQEIQEANDHVCGRQTIEGAPQLRDEHLSVFDTANKNGRYGTRFIHHTGHIKMMAAAQPFISGAISKTINMPHEVTPEEIEDAYHMSWELGLKAMALYRDGSKAAQPLNSKSDDGVSEEEDETVTQAMEAEAKIHWGNIPAGLSPTQAYASGMKPPRFLLPARRSGYNQEARVGGHKVFLRTGEYEDGTLGEIFIDLAKEGATLKGILSCFAIAVSKGLQYGVPLEEFVDTFTFQTFEPRGLVEGHPNIKMANSIIDYVFRSLGVEYLQRDELAQVPPNRDMELPEPKKGVAAEAGYQLELDDAMADSDVAAVQAAARFADSPATSESLPQPAKATVAVIDAGTASMQSALGEMMGDAPLCDTCGHITVRNGSCYKCLNCGNSLGCS
ncbi:MAG TPA: adenosylcobalamin-dependent ribonucleoside-diphosphate reductase [Acidimicrobiia bacterium]|nr:adenosylcobalamin-dependent ribonucleoside-diphosphate reductase [Acidimicrobiia bacterium]